MPGRQVGGRRTPAESPKQASGRGRGSAAGCRRARPDRPARRSGGCHRHPLRPGRRTSRLVGSTMPVDADLVGHADSARVSITTCSAFAWLRHVDERRRTRPVETPSRSPVWAIRPRSVRAAIAYRRRRPPARRFIAESSDVGVTCAARLSSSGGPSAPGRVASGAGRPGPPTWRSEPRRCGGP